MMIISLAVHHVVLVCAAAFELRVRLVVTDLARCPPHPSDPEEYPNPCHNPAIQSRDPLPESPYLWFWYPLDAAIAAQISN